MTLAQFTEPKLLVPRLLSERQEDVIVELANRLQSAERIENAGGFAQALLAHEPHQLPPSFDLHHVDFHAWLHWRHFATIGGPMLVGSLLIGAPTSILAFFLIRTVVARRQARNLQPRSL